MIEVGRERTPVAATAPAPALAGELAGAGAVLLAALFLGFFRLGQDSYANLYYAAAVKSMLTSWRALFFVAFDPGGFVSVDKPPLGFWLQAASARVFGFSPLSLLLPQALAGVLAVALLYYLVRRAAGRAAALIAALALALTPISVVTSRNNTVDSVLVLCALLAAWAASAAAERGSVRVLLLCAVALGLGFNVKMLDAYLALPACALLYLVGARLPLRLRLAHLAVAAVVLIAVSLAWATAVDLTPAGQRPYVGSSPSDSELQLALVYNGIDRLLPASGHAAASSGRFFGAAEVGQPGPLRLLTPQLGGQVSWLLPLAVLGLLAAAWEVRGRPFDRAGRALLLWGIWLLTAGAFFSLAGSLHAYYTVMLAPAVAALAGIGGAALWRAYRRPGWSSWLLPLALLGTAAAQARILAASPAWGQWLAPLTVCLALLAAVALAIVRLHGAATPRWRRGALALGALALLLGPAVWAAIPVVAHGEGAVPLAGPTRLGTAFAPAPSSGTHATTVLLSYLRVHRGRARFLVATVDALTAAPLILQTGEPVMALGGYSGQDRLLTREHLARLVARGVVRFFLVPQRHGAGWLAQQELLRWVGARCAAVPAQRVLPVAAGESLPGWEGSGPLRLFDCAGQ